MPPQGRPCDRRNGGADSDKNDAAANDDALDKVRADKVREANDGHDGTWVAHPGLVALARQAFDERMPGANQIDKLREDVEIRSEDLLTVPRGTITEKGVRHNVDIGIQYMEAWLAGNGCVPIYNLMEDAATSEISRSQLWQWLHHPDVTLEDGRKVDAAWMQTVFDEEMCNLRQAVGAERFDAGHYQLARTLIERIVYNDEFTEFMTTVGYDYLGRMES